MKTEIRLKRAYEAASDDDGFRIYVDALWPRGLSHETFHYDLWDKEIAPSAELRHFLHADPADDWPAFESRYAAELRTNPAFAPLLDEIRRHPRVTLLYSSHDTAHNNAVVLRKAVLDSL